MAKVEDSAVAMAIEEPFFAREIGQVRALSISKDEVDPDGLEKLDFTRGDRLGELVERFFFRKQPHEFWLGGVYLPLL